MINPNWAVNLVFLLLPLTQASLSLFVTNLANAESGPIVQKVALPVTIDRDVDEVLCIGRSAGKMLVSRGMLGSSSPSRGGERNREIQVMVGCGFSSPLDIDGSISVVVSRSGAILNIFGVRTEGVLEQEAQLSDEKKTGHRLIKQREVLASYQVQVQAQERVLDRLRSDADLIGAQTGFEKVEGQFKLLNSQSIALDRDLANLEASTRQIESQPSPANVAAREIEMTKQLAEMAQIARGVEQNNRQRSQEEEGQLAESMRLIEETRFEQPEQIRAELIKVRRRRQELEETLQDHTQNSLDYE